VTAPASRVPPDLTDRIAILSAAKTRCSSEKNRARSNGEGLPGNLLVRIMFENKHICSPCEQTRRSRVTSDQGEFVELCDATSVSPDTPARAEVNGEVYAVFEVDGEYYVTEDQCTHGPGSLSEGIVEGDEIECPFHQGRFNIRTGEPTLPPCMVALRTWTTQVRDGKILICPARVKTHAE
jgi:nitrite reductase/ring-hydroxylating ferredoxin subunit